MKRLLLVVLMLCFAVSSFAATAVKREGVYVDQYKIDDPGGLYDNNLVYLATQISEVVIQVSSVNTHTSRENTLCWDDPDVVECPTDWIDGNWRMPTLVFLDGLMAAGLVTTGVPLTDLMEKNIYLSFWHEYKVKGLVRDVIEQMDIEGLNELQKRRGLKFVYFGNGVDITTAQSIANDRIINGVLPGWDAYGLATMPLRDRRLLKLFGEVGWFE